MDGKMAMHISYVGQALSRNVCVPQGGSRETNLVFQSWEKAAFQDCSGAGIRGSKEGFV